MPRPRGVSMTRMWGIKPELMCDDHLRGEHKEMHQIVGSIRKHPHGRAIVEGHADKKQIDTTLIQERHDELADELMRRGMEHNSPLSYQDELNLGEIDIEENIIDLRNRCNECKV